MLFRSAQISAGKLEALGVSIAKRSSALPEVPTIAETGLKGYYAASWYGLMLPNGVPKDTLDVLSREIAKSMHVPDVKEKMAAQGFEPVGDSPAAFAKFLREEIARWEKVVKLAGIKPE